MNYLTSNLSGTTRRAAYAKNPALGLLLSPLGWRSPWCPLWACDNDVYAAWEAFEIKRTTTVTPEQDWFHGGEGKRKAAGEKRWLKMLDKVTAFHHPLFVILPDVVGDWEATIERAHQYRHEVESRGLRVALALQDGCNWKEAIDFEPWAVFVGGSKPWKWANVPRIVQMFQHKAWVHVGKVNGDRAIRYCRKLGVDSCDGTGLCRHFDSELPKVLFGLNGERPQMELF